VKPSPFQRPVHRSSKLENNSRMP